MLVANWKHHISVLIRFLQKIEPVEYISIKRCKELAHVIVWTDKSKICRETIKLEIKVRSDVAVLSLKARKPEQNFSVLQCGGTITFPRNLTLCS